MPSTPKKSLSKADIVDLTNLPSQVMEAFNTLTGFGVDKVRLKKLIDNRTRSSGRPKQDDTTARLIFSINCYLQDHPGTSIRSAIRAVIKTTQENYTRNGIEKRPLTGAKLAAKVRALEVVYSRATKGT